MQTVARQQSNDVQEDLSTISKTLNGDNAARTKINASVEPIIRFQTDRFCKRFCSENRFLYKCTLSKPISQAPQDALLCEWGNASYAWMLDDLTNHNRLAKYEGTNGARLFDYLYFIANSLPFYERWKNWRFGRRINVPDYIKDISPNAARAFLALRSGDNAPLVAQKLGISEVDADDVIQKIIIVLTQRNKLHLLQADHHVSLTDYAQDGDENGQETDIVSFDADIEDVEQKRQLAQAWDQLDAVEQFILEAMLIEEQDANDVLAALIELDIRLNEKIPAEQTDRQQLYYFRRKALAKLAKLAGVTDQ